MVCRDRLGCDIKYSALVGGIVLCLRMIVFLLPFVYLESTEDVQMMVSEILGPVKTGVPVPCQYLIPVEVTLAIVDLAVRTQRREVPEVLGIGIVGVEERGQASAPV